LLIKKEIKQSINLSLLLIFFCLSSIIVHAIAPFIAWVTLVLLFIGYLLYKIILEDGKSNHHFKSLNLIILFGIALFSYWMYTTRYGLDQFSTFFQSQSSFNIFKRSAFHHIVVFCTSRLFTNAQ
jgi:signal transduction histidine kinase